MFRGPSRIIHRQTCNRKYARTCFRSKISKDGLQLSSVDSCTLQLVSDMLSHLLSCRHLDLFEIKFFSCPQSFRSIILCDNSSFPTPSNFAHPLPFYAVMEKVLMPKNMPKSSALLVFRTTSIHCITFRMLRLKLTLSLTILMLTLTLMTLLTITILHQQQCGVKP